jgi:hypothetical protein
MMPEDERDVVLDADEDFAWDCDLQAPGEAEVADLLEEEDC